MAPGTLVNNITNAFFLTKIATGKYCIECACGESGMAPGAQPQLPNTQGQPSAFLNLGSDAPSGTITAEYGTGLEYGNVAIFVYISEGVTYTDIPFTVEFY